MEWIKAAVIGYGVVMLAVILFFALVYRRSIQREQHERNMTQASKHAWWRWRWSQDGWVRKCKICGAIQYGGDNYDGGPDDAGSVVQAG